MLGLVPGIHVLFCGDKDVDGRDKPGHDGECGSAVSYSALLTSLMRGSAFSIRPR
jgi:hypothetical protein